jgi:uncharacterized protein (TIGR02145 family)
MRWRLIENAHRYKAVTPYARTGFGAVPAGNRRNDGLQFEGRGTIARYWSSSVGSSSLAWRRGFDYNYAQAGRNLISRSYGFAVRCVRESKKHKHKLTAFF